ncbi:MAG: leucine-rich repeat domain-containing protein [Bacteroidales bacterium]|nr:leucine-rich repeat domain-containing protein [Bacteroidales bacterium]
MLLLCCDHWDTDHDGSLSYAEAAAVTSLGTVFRGNTTITRFRELDYFTSLVTIDASAFEGCSKLERVGIPNSVTSIGSNAFKDCSAMDKVYVPSINHWCGITFANAAANPLSNNATEFWVKRSGGDGYDKLASLSFPESVTTISNYAFYGCSGFTGDLVIPNAVTSIGDYAFYGCSGFTGDLVIPNAVTTIGQNAFNGCTGFSGSLTIGNSVTTIGQYAFNGCTGFAGSLTISNSVMTIGDYAFEGCSGFTGDLDIPNVVTTIGQYAFKGCSGCTGSLTIGNSVMTIGKYAFYDCSGFTGDLVIPNSVTTIGNYAFNGCTGFSGSLTIGNSVTTIDNYAFNGCTGFSESLTIGNSVTTIGQYAFKDCTGFSGNLILPNSLIDIKYRAFYGCSGFTGDLVIPNSVTSVGVEAFDGCTGFTGNLIIGNSVTSVGAEAFDGCTNFTGCLIIGQSVTLLRDYAFWGCGGFSSIIVDAPTPPTTGSSVFQDVPTDIPIYVPYDTKSQYISGWNHFNASQYVEQYEFRYDEDWDTKWSNDDNWIPEKPTSDDVVVCVTTNCLLDVDVNVLHLYMKDNADVLTINNGKTLTATYGAGSKLPSQLVIEEGGQLVTNIPTLGTVQKHIDAFSSANDGWSFIASPVTESLTASAVSGLIPSGETVYDLYYLDEENTYWRNYKQNAFELNHNQGYLYANQAGTDINFSGIMQPYVAEGVSIPLTKEGEGWNLVGNPFTFNTYANKPYYVINGRNVEAAASGAIAPCTGIVVKAEGTANETVKFTKDEPVTSSASSNGSLQIVLAEANTRGVSRIDNAIVSFNDGDELSKFYFGEQDANIYLPQNDEDYAIACAAKTGELPLNFKATKNGEYTLSVNPEDVEMEYLHLIDNMTGADIDLLQTPDYTFNAKTMDYASRFRLVFSANSVDENGASTGSEAFAYISNDEIVLTDATADATLQIVDVTGRIVSTHNASTHISINGLTAGVYVLRLINGENVKTQKTVVK